MMCKHSFILEIATYYDAVYPELEWIEYWILCVRHNERSDDLLVASWVTVPSQCRVESDRAPPPARACARAPPPSWCGGSYRSKL
jgi:hypothetical protein